VVRLNSGVQTKVAIAIRERHVVYTDRPTPVIISVFHYLLCPLCVVAVLREAAGPSEFEALGMKFQGASGPLILAANVSRLYHGIEILVDAKPIRIDSNRSSAARDPDALDTLSIHTVEYPPKAETGHSNLLTRSGCRPDSFTSVTPVNSRGAGHKGFGSF